MIKKSKRGIYLLPNLLTTFGLFAGFYSIILAINSEFIASGVAIFIAMIWDSLDGRVARLTNTQSSFGEQYDSMADLLSFGIAPAFLLYFYLLVNFNNIGKIAVFIYIAAVSLRLARFNSQVEIIDKKYFQGLPSPAGAAFIAGFVWVSKDFNIDISYLSIIAIFLLIITAILMVSNVRYNSFKDAKLSDKISFKSLLVLVMIAIIVSIFPSLILFIFILIYIISGIFYTVSAINKKRKLKKFAN